MLAISIADKKVFNRLGSKTIPSEKNDSKSKRNQKLRSLPNQTFQTYPLLCGRQAGNLGLVLVYKALNYLQECRAEPETGATIWFDPPCQHGTS